ncbi:MAG: hypothetical protein ACFFCS_27690, partial [Candidatus Hodarchaeota archaeon]
MGMERNNEPENEPDENGEDKDLMKSTLIALGWEESKDDEKRKGLEEGADKIKILQEQNEIILSELKNKESLITELNERIESLMEENKEWKERIQAGMKDTPSMALPSLNGEEMVDLKEKIALYEKVNRELQEKLKNLGDATVATEDNAEIKAELEQLKENITEKEKTIEELGQDKNDLEERVSELKQQIVDIIGENTTLSGEIQTKLKQLSQKDTNLDNMRLDLQQHQEELKKVNLAFDAIKAEKDELKFQIKDLEDLVESQKKELLQSVSDTSEGMGQLQQIIDEKTQDAEHLKKQLQLKDTKIESLHEKLELMEKDNIGTQAVLDKSNRELEEFREKFYLQKNIIKKLEIQLNDLKDKSL